jgi:hypothetical protein
MDTIWTELSLWAALFLGLVVAIELGFRIGLRQAGRHAEQASHVVTVQGAMLALLGLLLGFAFAGATTRFVERQDIIVREANSIGTAFLRADLIDEPHRERLRDALREYTEQRLALFATADGTRSHDVAAKLDAIKDRIWTIAVEGVQPRPAFAIAVLAPINDIIDLLAVRNAATTRHLPALIVGVLVACALATFMSIGLTSGLERRRSVFLPGVFAFLVASALWVTFDLDYPRRGFIQVTDAPLREAQLSMVRPGTSPAR